MKRFPKMWSLAGLAFVTVLFGNVPQSHAQTITVRKLNDAQLTAIAAMKPETTQLLNKLAADLNSLNQQSPSATSAELLAQALRDMIHVSKAVSDDLGIANYGGVLTGSESGEGLGDTVGAPGSFGKMIDKFLGDGGNGPGVLANTGNENSGEPVPSAGGVPQVGTLDGAVKAEDADTDGLGKGASIVRTAPGYVKHSNIGQENGALAGPGEKISLQGTEDGKKPASEKQSTDGTRQTGSNDADKGLSVSESRSGRQPAQTTREKGDVMQNAGTALGASAPAKAPTPVDTGSPALEGWWIGGSSGKRTPDPMANDRGQTLTPAGQKKIERSLGTNGLPTVTGAPGGTPKATYTPNPDADDRPANGEVKLEIDPKGAVEGQTKNNAEGANVNPK